MCASIKKYPCIIKGVEQVYPNVSPGVPIYANSVVVNDIVFVSGMTAQDPEVGTCLTNTVEDQMNVVLTKLKNALEEAGSSLDNLVKTLIFLKDVKDYPVMRAAELKFYQEHAPSLVSAPPASTFLQPQEMARPEFLVEIEGIGVINKK